jgi:hypothetical protein
VIVNDNFDRNKSLQELDGQDWGEPTFDSSVVTTCHRLHRKPLNQFTVEDLRIMIGQQISLPVLIPLALERLEADSLAEGDFYPGDLLSAVSRIDKKFWLNHGELFLRAQRVLGLLRDSMPALDEDDRQTVREILQRAPEMFGLGPSQ